MSISGIEDILPRYQEIADGSKKEYIVAFDLIDTKFVSVYLGSDKQSSGFNIDVENKKIIFDSAPSSGLLVTIVRAVPVSWESTLHGAINSEGINNLLTHIVASIQTVKEEVSRAVKSNVYDQNEGGQLSDFFLKQLTDAQDILDRSENTLSLLNTTIQNALSSVETARSEAINDINSTYQENLNDINEASSTALSSIGGAKDSAIASIEVLVTSAEESETNAKVSETNAKVSETNAKASEVKAQQIADSIVNNSANKDLSNLSATGQAKLDAKQTTANLSQTLDDSTTKYPSNNAVKVVVDVKQDISNLSQTLDDSTSKYPSNNAVKEAIDAKDSLPSQSGQSGKFLTTDGTTASWGTVDVSGAINTHNTDLNAHSNKFQVVSALPSSPNASVFYFIPE